MGVAREGEEGRGVGGSFILFFNFQAVEQETLKEKLAHKLIAIIFN